MEDVEKWMLIAERGVIIIGILYSIFTTNKTGFDIRTAVDALGSTRITGRMDGKEVNLKAEVPPDVPKT